MATVVLSKTQTQSLTTNKHDPTQAYLNHLWMNFMGNLSFIVVVSFLFIPVCFTAFLFVYFGVLHGIAFIAAVCAYNRIESKYHPLGETKRRWELFINFIGKLIPLIYLTICIDRFSGTLWEPFARMKHVEVVKLATDSFYSPHRQYMFCFHPHGILFLGPSTVVFNMEKYLKKIKFTYYHFSVLPISYSLILQTYFPGIKCSHLMSSSSFIAPIFRQFCIWIGGIPVTKGMFIPFLQPTLLLFRYLDLTWKYTQSISCSWWPC
jgi:hypothetical protein